MAARRGIVRGQGLRPLYENGPLAALEDNALSELMTLFDSLRVGQARERVLAGGLLVERLQ